MSSLPRHSCAHALLILAIASCEAGVGSDERVVEGELVTLVSSDVEPCGGMVGFLDRMGAAAVHFWSGSSTPSDAHVELELRAGDPDHAGFDGKAFPADGVAWVDGQQVALHEYVHLLVGITDPELPAPFLGEGVAEAMAAGDRSALWGWPMGEGVEVPSLPFGEFDTQHYAPAGQLVVELFRQHGIARVREAYRATSREQTSAEIEASLVDVFGPSFVEDVRAFEEEFDRCAGFQVWECSEEVLPVAKLPVAVQTSPDECADDPAVLGARTPDNGRWFPYHHFILDFAEETSIEIDLGDNAVVTFEQCIVSSCDEAPPGDPSGFGPDSIAPGDALQLTRPVGRVHVVVRGLDPLAAYRAEIRQL